MGRRLGEFTANNTKCMLEVNGVRLIDRMLTQLSALALSRIIIVVGYEGAKLKEYIQSRYQSLTIEFVNNPIYDKTNNIYSLWLTRNYMGQDETLLLESDLIFEDAVLQQPWTRLTATAPSCRNTRHGWTAQWCASTMTTTS